MTMMVIVEVGFGTKFGRFKAIRFIPKVVDFYILK